MTSFRSVTPHSLVSLPSAFNHIRGYRYFCDPAIHAGILEFHSRTVLSFPAGLAVGYVDSEGLDRQLRVTEGADTEFFTVSRRKVPLRATAPLRGPLRTSAVDFSPGYVVPFARLSRILRTALCAPAARPRRRPYASAGALYPIEVFLVLFRPHANALDAGAYHLAPHDCCLRHLWPVPRREHRHFFDANLGHCPSVSLIYVLNVRKAIFKYRWRGYRNALYEVGAMYHAVDLSARREKLVTRCWAGFPDNRVSALLKLDRSEYLPLLVHQLGREA